MATKEMGLQGCRRVNRWQQQQLFRPPPPHFLTYPGQRDFLDQRPPLSPSARRAGHCHGGHTSILETVSRCVIIFRSVRGCQSRLRGSLS